MDAHDQTAVGAWPDRPTPSLRDEPCANCAERTCLRTLVAELLYKNQELRFDLLKANVQLEEFKRAPAETAFRSMTQPQSGDNVLED